MKGILLITGIILSVMLLSGCQTRDRDIWCKQGTVVKIDENVIFGGTFTDWRDDIYFSDGTVLSSQRCNLFGIELNRSGRFYFEKNYFTYNGCEYRFDNFVRVEYDGNLQL